MILNPLGAVTFWVSVTCCVWWQASTFSSLCVLLRTLFVIVWIHIINIMGIVIDDKRNIKYSGCLGLIYFLPLVVWFGYGVELGVFHVCFSAECFFFPIDEQWEGSSTVSQGLCSSPMSLVPIAVHTYFSPSIFPRLCKQELTPCSI